VFDTTPRGRAGGRTGARNWTEQTEWPAFLTWLALSWQSRPGIVLKQLRRRQKFLEGELAHKQEMLMAVRKEVGHRYHEAVWMLSLCIAQLRTELRWLKKVARELPRRSTARNPEYGVK